MPIISNTSESIEYDPNTFHYPNFDATAHGNAPSTSNTFLNDIINKNIPDTSNKSNDPNNIGKVPLSIARVFVVSQGSLKK